jgi:hypothetical protein
MPTPAAITTITPADSEEDPGAEIDDEPEESEELDEVA